MNSLKQKVVASILWNFIEVFLSRGVSIVAMLLLAWFLVPDEFALVAMLAVFIQLSSFLVDGGLKEALIRKAKLSDLELNTVFFTNISLSLLIYGLGFYLAPVIAGFYTEPRLTDLIRVVLAANFFNGLVIVPRVLLSRAFKFKLQLKVNIPAVVLSSLIAVVLAYLGYGVWALIWQVVSNSFFVFVFFWLLNIWQPKLCFSLQVLRELFGFSSYLILARLTQIPFANMYLIVLPKYFVAGPVGLYFFAEKMKDVLVGLIVNTVQAVTYPALSQLQEDQLRLKQGYRKVIATTTFLMFPMMIFVAALAPVLFEVLLPETWQGASLYLQLMCLASLMFPLNSINLNILKVKGRSDLIFYVGLLKKVIAIAIFIYTVQIGISEIILGQMMASVINYVPNAYYSSKLIKYSITEQLSDFLPGLVLSGLIGGLIYFLQLELHWKPSVELVSFGMLAVCLYFLGAYLFRLHAFELIQGLFIKKFEKKVFIP